MLVTAMTMNCKDILRAVSDSFQRGEMLWWTGSMGSAHATKPVAVAVPPSL